MWGESKWVFHIFVRVCIFVLVCTRAHFGLSLELELPWRCWRCRGCSRRAYGCIHSVTVFCLLCSLFILRPKMVHVKRDQKRKSKETRMSWSSSKPLNPNPGAVEVPNPPEDTASQLVWSPNNEYFACPSWDKKARIW